MEFGFGTKVRDKITGLEGTVTGFTNYITGCAQCLVQPSTDKDGKYVEGRWIDQDRLSAIEGAPVITLDDRKHSGPDLPAPIR